MPESSDEAGNLTRMRASFEAQLPNRVQRALSVKLQPIIPGHWFAAAASECAGMYISGFFYGAISVAQAYVEALSSYLAQHHHIRVGKDVGERCRKLHREGIISPSALDAALGIFNNRNDYHHLNRHVEQEYQKLKARAKSALT